MGTDDEGEEEEREIFFIDHEVYVHVYIVEINDIY